MNMYASGWVTPSCTNAGAMITAAMMNEAVTGTARPRTSTANADRITVQMSTAVWLSVNAFAAPTMISARFSPSPVWVVIATMMPATAQVAATGSTERVPWASAANNGLTVNRCSRSRKDSANWISTAYTTALNGGTSTAMKPMITN